MQPKSQRIDNEQRGAALIGLAIEVYVASCFAILVKKRFKGLSPQSSPTQIVKGFEARNLASCLVSVDCIGTLSLFCIGNRS
jgi:hypothetical protein